MGRVYVEQRTLRTGNSLSSDMARHLFTRLLPGVVMIVAEKPKTVLAALRKQWVKLIVLLERERASTLRAERKCELDRLIAIAKSLPFALDEAQLVGYTHAVLIATEREPPTIPSQCHTVYITGATTQALAKKIACGVPRHSLVVIYDAAAALAVAGAS